MTSDARQNHALKRRSPTYASALQASVTLGPGTQAAPARNRQMRSRHRLNRTARTATTKLAQLNQAHRASTQTSGASETRLLASGGRRPLARRADPGAPGVYRQVQTAQRKRTNGKPLVLGEIRQHARHSEARSRNRCRQAALAMTDAVDNRWRVPPSGSRYSAGWIPAISAPRRHPSMTEASRSPGRQRPGC